MKVVPIRRNATLKKDGDGAFWLLLQSSAGPAMFNLSAININSITGETKDIGFDEVLGAFMREQGPPAVQSVNLN